MALLAKCNAIIWIFKPKIDWNNVCFTLSRSIINIRINRDFLQSDLRLLLKKTKEVLKKSFPIFSTTTDFWQPLL